MILKFEEWLTEQNAREDRIGDFARVLGKVEFPPLFLKHKWDEHKGWAELVTRIPEPGYVPTFNLAWREYVLAKESALESLD